MSKVHTHFPKKVLIVVGMRVALVVAEMQGCVALRIGIKDFH